MVVVAGLYAGLTMKQESIPSITLPAVTVVTVYPGAAPDEGGSGDGRQDTIPAFLR